MSDKPNLKRLGGCKPKPALVRFQSSYAASDDGCWIWLGAPQGSNGYGSLKVDGRKTFAHRYSWALVNGPVPPGLCVLHRCDRPLCVNPEHLFLGSNQDNVDDRTAKGRSAGNKTNHHAGASHYKTTLSESDVRRIRADSRAHNLIARDYKISNPAVSAIKSRRTWRHVP